MNIDHHWKLDELCYVMFENDIFVSLQPRKVFYFACVANLWANFRMTVVIYEIYDIDVNALTVQKFPGCFYLYISVTIYIECSSSRGDNLWDEDLIKHKRQKLFLKQKFYLKTIGQVGNCDIRSQTKHYDLDAGKTAYCFSQVHRPATLYTGIMACWSFCLLVYIIVR